MLEAYINFNTDSQDQLFLRQRRQQVQFQYPPSNVKNVLWKSKEDLLLYLHKKAYQIGFFDGRMFNCRRMAQKYLGILKCRICDSKITLIIDDDGVRIKTLHNWHRHDLRKHDPQFLKRFTYFQDNHFSDHVDQLDDLFNLQTAKVRIVQNTFYQRFITFDQILQKTQRQYGVKFKIWRDNKNMPYMILLVTRTMIQTYKKYGDSLSFDCLPKLNQLRRSKYYAKFWITYTFAGMDSNNRLALFGVSLIAHNDNLYYKKSQILYQLFQQFFSIMQNIKQPQTIISNQTNYHLQAFNKLKIQKNYQWTYLIGWSYKLRNLMCQMRGYGYDKQQMTKLLYLYSSLLRQADQSNFISIVGKISQISKQQNILFDFLVNMDKYCFIAFPSKFCGFGFTVSRMEVYSKMTHFLLHKHNFYRHFLCIMHYQTVLLRQNQRVTLAPRKHFFRVQQQLKRTVHDLQKELGFFRSPQPYKTQCLQTKIFYKVIQNFNLQRILTLNKINQNLYNISKKNQHGDLCKVMYFQNDNLWHCSCMYMTKLGIPCAHLVKVMLKQRVQISKYFNKRWLRKQQIRSKPAYQVLSRKRRRHD